MKKIILASLVSLGIIGMTTLGAIPIVKTIDSLEIPLVNKLSIFNDNIIEKSIVEQQYIKKCLEKVGD
jgi:hypothetical protein